MMPLPFIFFLLIPLVAPPVAYARDSYEQRCFDLENDAEPASGTECLCSEPLNTNQTFVGSSDNPDDSLAIDGFECGISGNFLSFGASSFDGVSDSATLDTDYADIDYVQSRAVGGGAAGTGSLGNHEEVDMTDMTFCVRAHLGFETGYRGPQTNADQTKLFYIQNNVDNRWSPYVRIRLENCNGCNSDPANTGIRIESPTSTTGHSMWEYGGQTTYSCSGTVTLEDLYDDVDNYIETCFDHNDSSFTADSLNTRIRVVAGGGATRTCTELSTNTNSASETSSRMEPIKSECRDDDSSGDMDCSKHYYYSHVMIATKSPADDTFWIGPASEISGGGAAPATGLAGGSVTGGSLQ